MSNSQKNSNNPSSPAAQPAPDEHRADTPAAAEAPAAAARRGKFDPAAQRRTLVIVLAAVLVCAIALALILLLVPEPTSPGPDSYQFRDLRETKIESIAAYNEENQTNFCFSTPTEAMENNFSSTCYLYEAGRVDVLLRQSVSYSSATLDLYMQIDPEDTIDLFRSYTNLPEKINLREDDSLPVLYSETDGLYLACVTYGEVTYYLRMDCSADNHFAYFLTLLTSIF